MYVNVITIINISLLYEIFPTYGFVLNIHNLRPLLYKEIIRIKNGLNKMACLGIGKMGRSISSYLCYYRVFRLYIDDRDVHI